LQVLELPAALLSTAKRIPAEALATIQVLVPKMIRVKTAELAKLLRIHRNSMWRPCARPDCWAIQPAP
jgi:hypothetical protein